MGTGHGVWVLGLHFGCFLLIPPLLFEEDTGEYHNLLLLNDVYVHEKDERNYSNSFRVMAKNVTCVDSRSKYLDLTVYNQSLV